jgi:hypothetical protein
MEVEVVAVVVLVNLWEHLIESMKQMVVELVYFWVVGVAVVVLN